MTELSEAARRAIADARGLLGTLIESDWTEIHVAFGDTEIFIAREGGRANPMREALAAPEPEARAFAGTTVSAPHVATFIEALPVGAAVEQGARIASLSLLDEVFELAAPVSGTVSIHYVAAGEMVEFGAAIVEIESLAA